MLAVNYPALEKWVPAELAATDERFAGLEKLESVPILVGHMWSDRADHGTTSARGADVGHLQSIFAKPARWGKRCMAYRRGAGLGRAVHR